MTDRDERHLKRQRARWYIWKVLLPFTLLAAIWPVYSLVLGLDDAFAMAFAHGDYLVFAALVLIEVSVDGDEVRARSSGDSGDGWYHEWGLPVIMAFGFLLMSTFGFIRFDVTRTLEVGAAEAQVHASPSAEDGPEADPESSGPLVVDNRHPAGASEPVPERSHRLIGYACFNASVAILAVASAFYASTKNLETEVKSLLVAHSGAVQSGR